MHKFVKPLVTGAAAFVAGTESKKFLAGAAFTQSVPPGGALFYVYFWGLPVVAAGAAAFAVDRVL